MFRLGIQVLAGGQKFIVTSKDRKETDLSEWAFDIARRTLSLLGRPWYPVFQSWAPLGCAAAEGIGALLKCSFAEMQR